MLIAAAVGLDRSWTERAACLGWATQAPGRPTPWQVGPGRRAAGSDVSNSELVKLALLICRGCPVQYDCARYAVEGMMLAGTWGMPLTALEWLRKQDDWEELVEFAETVGAPIQDVVADVRRDRLDNA